MDHISLFIPRDVHVEFDQEKLGVIASMPYRLAEVEGVLLWIEPQALAVLAPHPFLGPSLAYD